jgi:hypothetical protein
MQAQTFAGQLRKGGRNARVIKSGKRYRVYMGVSDKEGNTQTWRK